MQDTAYDSAAIKSLVQCQEPRYQGLWDSIPHRVLHLGRGQLPLDHLSLKEI